MNIFVAGASGAIGRPLITALIGQGHAVTGMTRSEERTAQNCVVFGPVDRSDQCLRRTGGGAGDATMPGRRRDRRVDGSAQKYRGHGRRRARRSEAAVSRGAAICTARRGRTVCAGICSRRVVFFSGPDVGWPTSPRGWRSTPHLAWLPAHETYAELKARVLSPSQMEGVVLRYGFFYGPNTWYDPDGAPRPGPTAKDSDHRHRQGVWSWVHIEDAALATVTALTAPAGVYHIVGDEPSPLSEWLPAFARWVGARLARGKSRNKRP